MGERDAPVREDGRTLRARRTRTQIVDAVLALLEEGELRPTAEQIAARAGVSTRSIFQHFRDRDALFAAVGEREAKRAMELVQSHPVDGPLAERLDSFVAQRAQIWELVTPSRRAAVLNEPFSESIAAPLRTMRAIAGAECERIFAPELGKLSEEDRPVRLAAAIAVSEWPFWEMLRVHQELDCDEAAGVVRASLRALLEP